MDNFDTTIQSDEYDYYYDAWQDIFESEEAFSDFPELDEI